MKKFLSRSEERRFNMQKKLRSEHKPHFEINDIVQITNHNHPWFMCLLVVSEVGPMFIKGYMKGLSCSDIDPIIVNYYTPVRIEFVEKVGHLFVVEK